MDELKEGEVTQQMKLTMRGGSALAGSMKGTAEKVQGRG